MKKTSALIIALAAWPPVAGAPKGCGGRSTATADATATPNRDTIRGLLRIKS